MKIKIVIWNITSVRDKEYELIHEMNNYKIQVLRLSVMKKAKKSKNNTKRFLYYSEVPRGQRAKKEVEMVMINDLNKKLITFMMEFMIIIIIILYALIEGTD